MHDPESLLASKSSELVTFGAAATSLFMCMGSKRLTFGREAQGPVLHLCTSYLSLLLHLKILYVIKCYQVVKQRAEV